MPSSRKNRLWAGICTVIGAAILMLDFFDPATSGLFPPCPLRYLTGWYCPGCGSLRALHQLLHGNLGAAWALNPLTVILLPFLVYGIASSAVFEIRGRHLPRLFLPAVSIRVLCAVIILFGIARNIPFHPFDLLAPSAIIHHSGNPSLR
jgi:zinc transporter ZupT